MAAMTPPMPDPGKLRAELFVSSNLECAHKALLTGKMHGHSYVVTVFFIADMDIECAAAAIKTITSLVDHTQLEESVGGPRMEDLAEWLMVRLCLLAAMEVTRVTVARPTLGYGCELRRE